MRVSIQWGPCTRLSDDFKAPTRCQFGGLTARNSSQFRCYAGSERPEGLSSGLGYAESDGAPFVTFGAPVPWTTLIHDWWPAATPEPCLVSEECRDGENIKVTSIHLASGHCHTHTTFGVSA